MESTFADHQLPSGLRIVCETMPRVSSAAVGFLARTGSRHEGPGQHGVSHFLEHMSFKGTAKRSWHDVNVRFDELGSIYNAFTGKEHTFYFGWVPADRVEPQLELLADMMRPRLAPEDFETERNVILEEIAMSGDNFDHHVWNLLHETVFDGHPLAHEILGEHDDIANMRLEVMRDYHREHYAADRMILIASGNICAEALFAAAGRYCEDWQRSPRPAPPLEKPPALPSGVFKRQLEQFNQQSIVLIYPSIPHTHPQTETVELFRSLFGGVNSRCYWNIVQKGICSAAGAAWLSYADYGVMALYADGEPDRAEEMLDALRQQAREVSEQGFTSEELQRVKNRRRTNLALEGENPRTRMMQLIDDIESCGHVRPADARLAATEAVTARSIAAYLERYPITGDGLLLSAGPRDWP